MVELTVYLNPALTGVKSEMWVMLLVEGEGVWYYVMDTPSSVNGVIGPFGYTDPYLPNIHQIRFPEQTINGVTYEETQTSGFMITQGWTFNITLTPKVEPPKPPLVPTLFPVMAAPPLIAGAILIYLSGR